MTTLVFEFLFLLFSNLILLTLAGGDGNAYGGECPPSFSCGYLGNITFPFTIKERQDCGLLAIQNCSDHPLTPKIIQLHDKGKLFVVINLTHNPSDTTSIFRDTNLQELLESRDCEAFRHNYTLPTTFNFTSFGIKDNTTLFRCNRSLHVSPTTNMQKYANCSDYDLYYGPLIPEDDALTACTKVHLPIKDLPVAKDPFTFVTANMITEVKVTGECANCHNRQRGRCQLDSGGRFCCANGILRQKPRKHKDK